MYIKTVERYFDYNLVGWSCGVEVETGESENDE